MKILEIQNELIEEFNIFDDWQQKYEYLIDLGKSLHSLPEEKKIEEKLIQGCQSNVWFDAYKKGDKLFIQADSDAILPKGIIAMLTRVYSGQPINDILVSDAEFINKIGLQEFLSPIRANGLLAMIKQIKFYALAYSTKD